jgi:hypothetical protein
MVFFHRSFSFKINAAAPKTAIFGKVETLISRFFMVVG